MPCDVESVDFSLDLLWYCCNCREGPMNCAHTPACYSCNHERCAYPTPPDSPACASSHKGKKGPKDRRVREAAPTPRSVPSRLHSAECDTIPAPKNSIAFGELVEACTDDVESPPGVVQQTAFAVVFSAIFAVDLIGSPAVISCSPGEQATSHRGKRPLQSSSQRQSTKSGRRPSEKRGFDGRRDEEDGEEGTPKKRQNTGPKNGRKKPSIPLFACHFCKYNPSRFRHEQSCQNGFTGSNLREHYTRLKNPHSLNDCENCLRVFAEDEEAKLDAHRKEGTCTRRDITYPVEGVSSRLRSRTSTACIPDFRVSSIEEAEAWWKNIWISFFGPDVPIPENIYHNEGENIQRSNDFSYLGDFRDRLAQTLGSRLPQKVHGKATLRHLLSLVEAELHYFRGRMGSGDMLDSVREFLSQQMVVQPKRSPPGKARRKFGNDTNDDDQIQSDEPISDVFGNSKHMEQPSSLEVDDQAREDTPAQILPVESIGTGSEPASDFNIEEFLNADEGFYDTDPGTPQLVDTNPTYSEDFNPPAPSLPTPVIVLTTPAMATSLTVSLPPTQEELYLLQTHEEPYIPPTREAPPKKVFSGDVERSLSAASLNHSLDHPQSQHGFGKHSMLDLGACFPNDSNGYGLGLDDRDHSLENNLRQSHQTPETEPGGLNINDVIDSWVWENDDGLHKVQPYVKRAAQL